MPTLDTAWLHGLLSRNGESPWLEFKHNNDDPREMGEYVSALANGAALVGEPHGYLVWGVKDGTREFIGTGFNPERAKKGNEDLRFWLELQFKTQVVPEFFVVTEGALRAVVLRIPAANGQPVAFQGERYMRVQSSKVRLRDFPQQEKQLLERLAGTTFEQGIAAGALETAQVLQRLDASAFFKMSGEPVPTSAQELLDKLASRACVRRTLDGRYDVLNLGALLFAHDLALFGNLARKALRVVFYRGLSKAAVSDELQPGDKGYALVIDAVIEALRLRLPADEQVHGARRERREHFPELALRELIVNALVHQDFTVRGAGPLVEVFEDRVEVTNPGRPLMAVERLIDWPAQSRNEALARLMRLLRLCEERGSGIDRVVDAAETRGLPPPEFEVLAGEGGGTNFMRVHLLGPRLYVDMTPQERLRAVYQHACLLHQRGRRMDNSSLRTRFGLDDKAVAPVSRLIKQAREAGLIVPVGEGERSYLPAWANPREGQP